MTFVIHLCSAADWNTDSELPEYRGTALDRQDGFIHLSPVELATETANLYLKDQPEICVLWIAEDEIKHNLKYEVSRGDIAFPHLYGPLPRTAVKRIDVIRPGADGLFSVRSDTPSDGRE